jgi:DNA-directed RNA polymerase specialized sigma24 family protein
MSLHEPPDHPKTHAHAWSPETETREEVKALLRRRSALTRDEIVLFRSIYPDWYDTFVDTLCCVARSRGAPEAVELDVVHDGLASFWEQTCAAGFPESIQARLLGLVSGLARNYVRHERLNPTKFEMPTSSKESPGSFPTPESAARLEEMKELAHRFFLRLSDEHKAVVDAVVLRDLTVAAAARELGLSRTTAASRLTAALALLHAMADEVL